MEGGGASRSTEPASGTSAATDVSLREHLAQRLHESERRIDERDRYLREADMRLQEERDRRYMEVALEREKALRIKEQADRDALDLAREIQTYKDEKANELREQINSERGFYISRQEMVSLTEKIDAQIKPVLEFVQAQQGKQQGVGTSASVIAAVIGVVISLVTVAILVISQTN